MIDERGDVIDQGVLDSRLSSYVIWMWGKGPSVGGDTVDRAWRELVLRETL